jgi:hypothetical protein
MLNDSVSYFKRITTFSLPYLNFDINGTTFVLILVPLRVFSDHVYPKEIPYSFKFSSLPSSSYISGAVCLIAKPYPVLPYVIYNLLLAYF